LSMLGVRAVDAEHVSIANTTPGLQMKSGYEAAADKSDSKFVRQQTTLPGLRSQHFRIFSSSKPSVFAELNCDC
jgi:hypothetical protein